MSFEKFKMWLIKTGYKLWTRNWSLFYQWFKLKTMSKTSKIKCEAIMKNALAIPNAADRWHYICKDLEWKADGPGKLWDAIEHPYQILDEKGCDCDGYAYLSTFMFPGNLYVGEKSYIFAGLYCLINKDFTGGHMISVFYSYNSYAVISNGNLITFNADGFKTYCKRSGKTEYIMQLSRNLKFVWIKKISDFSL